MTFVLSSALSFPSRIVFFLAGLKSFWIHYFVMSSIRTALQSEENFWKLNKVTVVLKKLFQQTSRKL